MTGLCSEERAASAAGALTAEVIGCDAVLATACLLDKQSCYQLSTA
jgi:hypothetical protein